MKKSEIGFGICLITAGSILLHGALQLKGVAGLAVGPSLFPNIVGTGLLAVGLIISVLALRHTTEPARDGMPQARPATVLLRMAALFACIAAFGLLTPKFGFVGTGTIILAIFLRLTGVKTSKSLLIAVIATTVIYLLFDRILGAALPAGYIEQLL
jgi:putative tricarboxylic transport membrane protein